MGCKAFLPLLIGEIDLRSDKFFVGLGWFLTTGAINDWRDDALQFLKYILLRYWNLLLIAFVVKAVTAALQFTGLHASIGTFIYHWRTGIEHGSTHSA